MQTEFDHLENADRFACCEHQSTSVSMSKQIEYLLRMFQVDLINLNIPIRMQNIIMLCGKSLLLHLKMRTKTEQIVRKLKWKKSSHFEKHCEAKVMDVSNSFCLKSSQNDLWSLNRNYVWCYVRLFFPANVLMREKSTTNFRLFIF